MGSMPGWLAVALGAFAATMMGCAARGGGAEVTYIPLPAGSKLPFSAAVKVGPVLILSGMVGTDAAGALVPGGIEAETRQTLENIKALLQANGSSIDHVVKCTAMLADIAEWPRMNSVYVTYFTKNLPARSAFGASGLALGARIELECWATVASPE